MSTDASVRLYRGLLYLYPRRFRDEYGADMALLFAHQLHDEPAPRVWARLALDLAVSVPTRHLEAHVNRPPTMFVPVFFAALCLSSLLVGVVFGTGLEYLSVALVVACASGVIAVAAWRHTRSITTSRPATAHWWKFVVAGGGALLGLIALTTATGEVAEGWWGPTMIALLAALLTLAAGVVLGIAHLVLRRPGRPATRPA